MVDTAKRIVIDASVALKWRFRDEEAADQASALLEDYARGALQLLAPPLFDYEVVNALRTGVLRGRLTEDEALAALSDFDALSIERPPFRDTQHLALQLACRHECAAYDSAYLALAHANGLCFVTGDRKLFNLVARHLPWVLWIGDYSLDKIPESST